MFPGLFEAEQHVLDKCNRTEKYDDVTTRDPRAETGWILSARLEPLPIAFAVYKGKKYARVDSRHVGANGD